MEQLACNDIKQGVRMWKARGALEALQPNIDRLRTLYFNSNSPHAAALVAEIDRLKQEKDPQKAVPMILLFLNERASTLAARNP